MGNLFFPQLVSGAVSQYPIKKTSLVRTVKNVLADGSMILYRDPKGSQLIWQLEYSDLDTSDMQALQAHFAACAGPVHAFTFIDPTENMLVCSSDLTKAPWQSFNLVQLQPGLADPNGGTAGFTVTNFGQTNLEISQTLAVPAGYQYCFSLYATSVQPSQISLIRRGLLSVQQSTIFSLGAQWTRLVSSGRLADTGTQLTVAISLAAGQQMGLYGVQLEPQIAPSRYRPTGFNGGVYANAHWGVDRFTTVAEAPNLYSTSFSIETVIEE